MKKENCGLTEKQQSLLDAIVEYGSLKRVAVSLGISYSAAKQRLYRIRRRMRIAEGLLKELEKLGYDEIMAKIPACQTCRFLENDGKCKDSNDPIDVNGFDCPCIYWRQGELKGVKLS
jgi:hypothetical protein